MLKSHELKNIFKNSNISIFNVPTGRCFTLCSTFLKRKYYVPAETLLIFTVQRLLKFLFWVSYDSG